jgi:hypothetical protein
VLVARPVGIKEEATGASHQVWAEQQRKLLAAITIQSVARARVSRTRARSMKQAVGDRHHWTVESFRRPPPPPIYILYITPTKPAEPARRRCPSRARDGLTCARRRVYGDRP